MQGASLRISQASISPGSRKSRQPKRTWSRKAANIRSCCAEIPHHGNLFCPPRFRAQCCWGVSLIQLTPRPKADMDAGYLHLRTTSMRLTASTTTYLTQKLTTRSAKRINGADHWRSSVPQGHLKRGKRRKGAPQMASAGNSQRRWDDGFRTA